MTKPYLQVQKYSDDFPIIHGFTTKLISDDLSKLCSALKSDYQSIAYNLLPSQVFYPKQTHSGIVHYVDGNECTRDVEADALVTDVPGIVIAVRTADCVPLLVYDQEHKVVAAIHAGYRGVLNKIIQNTLGFMQKHFHSSLEDLQVIMGPCIHVQKYEVGPELIQEFQGLYGNQFSYDQREGQSYLNMPETVKMVLHDCGIDDLQIQDVNLCTHANVDLFHSWRRSQTSCRMLNFIGLAER